MDNRVSPPSNEVILRAKAREAFQNCKLPPRKPDRTLGGVGPGTHCLICGELITLTQMEIEELRELAPASAPSLSGDRRPPSGGLAPIKL